MKVVYHWDETCVDEKTFKYTVLNDQCKYCCKGGVIGEKDDDFFNNDNKKAKYKIWLTNIPGIYQRGGADTKGYKN